MKKIKDFLIKVDAFLYDWAKFLITLVSLSTICYVLLILSYAVVLFIWISCTKGF